MLILFLLFDSQQRPVLCHILLLLLYPLLQPFLTLFLFSPLLLFLLHCFPLLLQLNLLLLLLHVNLLLFLLLLSLSTVVLSQADVPCQAADGRHGLELVDHVARDEIDVVVAQADACVVNALAT